MNGVGDPVDKKQYKFSILLDNERGPHFILKKKHNIE